MFCLTCLALPVYGHDGGHCGEVNDGKDALRQEDVAPLVGQVVEGRVEVDVGSGIDEGSGAAPDLGVVALAADKLFDLLHVCLPIDLGVWGRESARGISWDVCRHDLQGTLSRTAMHNSASKARRAGGMKRDSLCLPLAMSASWPKADRACAGVLSLAIVSVHGGGLGRCLNLKLWKVRHGIGGVHVRVAKDGARTGKGGEIGGLTPCLARCPRQTRTMT
jgi:hypothetical protein